MWVLLECGYYLREGFIWGNMVSGAIHFSWMFYYSSTNTNFASHDFICVTEFVFYFCCKCLQCVLLHYRHLCCIKLGLPWCVRKSIVFYKMPYHSSLHLETYKHFVQLVYDRNHLFGLGSDTETETENWPKLLADTETNRNHKILNWKALYSFHIMSISK